MNRPEAGAVRDLVAFLRRYPEPDRAKAGVALARLSAAASSLLESAPELDADQATDLLSVSGPSDLRRVEPLPVGHGEHVEERARGAFERAKRAVAERNAVRGRDGGDRLLQTALTWERAEDYLNSSTSADLRAGRLSAAQEAAAAAGVCGQFAREALEAYTAAHQQSAAEQRKYVVPACSSEPASGAAL